MLERRSALIMALGRGGRDGAGGGRRCRIGEVKGSSLIQAAGFPSTLQIGSHSVVPGERTIFRTCPQQFWIVGPEDGLFGRLSEAIGPDFGTVTSLSHSRTRIFIEGDCAADILKKGVALDFHPQIFKPGQAALTGLHHTPVLIHRIREDRFEIYAMRTFALSVWEWLTDAALEFGYETAAEEAGS